MVFYYSKFHLEINHIEYFWYSAKQYSQFWYKYSLNNPRKKVPLVLESITNPICLTYYNRYYHKMQLYTLGKTLLIA